MNLVLQREDERNYRIYEIPTSAILIGGKKIKYFDFLTSLQNEGCNMALKRIVPRIDLEKINALIEETPFLSDLLKIFYKTMLRERKIKILDFALNSLEKRGANV